jgi:hypothetical protein
MRQYGAVIEEVPRTLMLISVDARLNSILEDDEAQPGASRAARAE